MKGAKLLDLTFLEEVGLLQEVATGFQLTMKPNEDGILLQSEGQLTLVVEASAEVKLDVIRITRVGREIVRILPSPNYMEILEDIEERMRPSIQSSKIMRLLVNEKDGALLWETVKTLKEKTT